MVYVKILISLLTACIGVSNAAHILATFPFTGKSHMIFFNALLHELARRGHHVTVVSSFPSGANIDNLEEIVFDRGLENTNMFELREQMKGLGFIDIFGKALEVSCQNSLNNSKVEPFIKGERPVDLLITTGLFGECHLGFLHVYKDAHLIQMLSLEGWTWMLSNFGNPLEIATVPDNFLAYTQEMSLKERIVNFFFTRSWSLAQQWILIPFQQPIMQKYFGPDVPSINYLLLKCSLFLMNSEISIGNSRALSPNIIQVGGMHIRNAKPLPQDLKKWLDEASDGVIYFSLGSTVRSTDLPKGKLEALLNSFNKLREKVLWKWEEDKLAGQPSNVRIGKWLPQSDLLSHPNIKLFITHGSHLRVQEATFHGIPILGIPIMGDQIINMKRVVSKGLGLLIEFENITKTSMTWALVEILNNPSYREKAQQLSKIFKDQPMKPLDKAVFWTEYVLRHNGAPHLSNPAKYLYWFQRELWDIYFVFISFSCLSIYILSYCLKIIVTFCRNRNKPKKE